MIIMKTEEANLKCNSQLYLSITEVTLDSQEEEVEKEEVLTIKAQDLID